MPPVRLYVFRHGETDFNRQWRFQGHLDIPLNSLGLKQAEQLVPLLAPLNLQAMLSSDLKRASQTARVVAQCLGLTLHSHPGLREAHLGDAQGLTRDEIALKFGKASVERWKSYNLTDADVSYPGGETGLQVMERVFEALELAVRSRPDIERWGVCTHGGVIRRMAQKLLPPGSEPVAIPNGVIYELNFDLTTGTWKFGPRILGH